jgi:hypothetical protein
VALLGNHWYNSILTERAAIELACWMEYIAAEVLEISGNATKNTRDKIVAPADISVAIDNDEELFQLFRNVIIRECGGSNVESSDQVLYDDVRGSQSNDSGGSCLNHALSEPDNGTFTDPRTGAMLIMNMDGVAVASRNTSRRSVKRDLVAEARSCKSRQDRKKAAYESLSPHQKAICESEFPQEATLASYKGINQSLMARNLIFQMSLARQCRSFCIERSVVRSIVDEAMETLGWRDVVVSVDAINAIHTEAENFIVRLMAVCLHPRRPPRPVVIAADKLRQHEICVNLFTCCCSGDLAGVKQWLSLGAYVHSRWRGQTPLMVACKYGHIRVAECLLDHGAHPSHVCDRRSLILAARGRHNDILHLLLSRTTDEYIENGVHGLRDWRTLGICVETRNSEGVAILIAAGADLEWSFSDEDRALHLACRLGFIEIAEQLVFAGCDINALDRQGSRAIDLLTIQTDKDRLLVAKTMADDPGFK